jgi:signal peptidase II
MATKKKSSSVPPSGARSMTPWLGIAFIVILVDQLTKITVSKLFSLWRNAAGHLLLQPGAGV